MHDTNSHRTHFNKNSTEVITITSGKGGVGKTNAAVNIAISLSKLNKKVCIFDADMGLANINILLGLQPEYNLQQVLSGEKNINEIIVNGPGKIQIIPAGSGVEKLADLNNEERERLIASLSTLQSKADILLIDTSAGISSNVLSFVIAADRAVVVLTPEPTSLSDAYAMIKVISLKGYNKPVWLLVNMVKSEETAKKIYKKMKSVAKKFLNIDLRFIGFVLLDENLPQSVMQQKPVCLLYPQSIASKCFAYLAEEIIGRKISDMPEHDFRSFWKNAMEIIRKPVVNFKRRDPDKKGEAAIQDPVKENFYNFYKKIDNLIEKVENILKDKRDIIDDLIMVKDENLKFTKELKELVGYIDQKGMDDGVVKDDDIIGISGNDINSGTAESSVNKVNYIIDSDSKNRFVEELNFEDVTTDGNGKKQI